LHWRDEDPTSSPVIDRTCLSGTRQPDRTACRRGFLDQAHARHHRARTGRLSALPVLPV